jgi:branched-chain amino acid transport system substrate-binding protein
VNIRGCTMRASALIVTGLLAIAIAGCGASATQNKASTNQSSPIVVGDIGSYSGLDASTYGGIPYVFTAWADSVNASGGIDGHQVKVINENIGTTTGAGLVAAKTLIQQDHVAAIIGDADPDDVTWTPYAESQGVPVFEMSVSVGAFNNPDVYPLVLSEFALGYAVADLARHAGAKFGTIYCDEVPNCATVSQQYGAFDKSLGLKEVEQLSVSSSAPSYTAQCESLKSAGVQSYSVVASAAVVQTIVDDCYALGYHAPPIELAASAQASWKTDKAFNGMLVGDNTEPFFATDTSAERALHDAISKYAPSIIGTSEDNTYAVVAWAAGQLFATAVKTAGAKAVTPATVKQGLYALPKGENLGGLTAALHYTPGKTTYIDCFFEWKVDNGAFVAPNPDKPICAPASVIAPVQEAGLKSFTGS